MAKEVPIQLKSADGTRLAGLHAAGPPRSRAVLLLHGISVNKDEWAGFYRELAAFLSARGFSTLRIDFRGHGDSGGDSRALTVAGAAADAAAALEFLLQSGAPAVALIGTSFGAGPALIAASRHPSVVDRIVLIAPVLDYRRTFLRPETAWGKENFNHRALRGLAESGTLTLDGSFPLGRPLFEEFREINLLRIARDLPQPILIFHGDHDTMVPFETSAKAAKSLSRNVKLHVIRGADHGFVDGDDEDGTSAASQSNKRTLFAETASFLEV